MQTFLRVLTTVIFSLAYVSQAFAYSSVGLGTSSNPSTAGTAITLTAGCGIKDNIVTFSYGLSSSSITNTIGTVSNLQGGSASISWTPPSAGTFYLQASEQSSPYCSGGNSGVITQVVNAPPSYQGYVDPKYVVVGVTYAPPGPSSFVTYSSGTTLATTKSTSATFSSNVTVSTSIATKTGIKGWAKGNVTVSNSNGVTQQSSSSSSVTLSLASQFATKTPGTPNAYSPVNHDYDIIWLWLNPVALYTVVPSQPGSIAWNGYGYDTTDQPALDIWPVYVGYLNGDFGTLDSQDAKVLARSWAAGQTWPSGQGPGLTQSDFNQILQADPFSNKSYTVVISSAASPATTTDGRFTISGGSGNAPSDFVYKQANPGSTASTQTFQDTYSNISTLGQSTTTTTQEMFGIDVSFTGSVFLASLTKDIKYTQTLTWTDMASESTSITATDIDSLSITGPPCATSTAPCVPGYTGTDEFDVYQDNIYGTFMFNPVN